MSFYELSKIFVGISVYFIFIGLIIFSMILFYYKSSLSTYFGYGKDSTSVPVPVNETEGPIISINETMAPIYETIAPVYTEEPVYITEEPIYQTMAPVYETEEPIYQTIEPVKETEEPIFTISPL